MSPSGEFLGNIAARDKVRKPNRGYARESSGNSESAGMHVMRILNPQTSQVYFSHNQILQENKVSFFLFLPCHERLTPARSLPWWRRSILVHSEDTHGNPPARFPPAPQLLSD